MNKPLELLGCGCPWNKECVYACCAATLQLTSSSDSRLLMVVPVSCLWPLFPDKKQFSISSLTLHQPSSRGKTRLLNLSPITPLPAWLLNWFWGWYNLLPSQCSWQHPLASTMKETFSLSRRKLFTMVLFLNFSIHTENFQLERKYQ